MIALRHLWVLGALGLAVGACAPQELRQIVEPPAPAEPEPAAQAAPTPPPVARPAPPPVDPELAAIYASRRDGNFDIPALDVSRFDRRFLRERVPFETEEAPGTIIIDTKSRHLFLVEDDGVAIRYGVSVGRPGFAWTGEGRIARKARWPRWTPPGEMIARDASLAKWRDGMPGGLRNPLGARALYIYFGERDSMFRVHGTNEPMSVGRQASSGCFRMLNHDVIDLHARVQNGAKIIVR